LAPKGQCTRCRKAKRKRRALGDRTEAGREPLLAAARINAAIRALREIKVIEAQRCARVIRAPVG
jgi:hypothetical protein